MLIQSRTHAPLALLYHVRGTGYAAVIYAIGADYHVRLTVHGTTDARNVGSLADANSLVSLFVLACRRYSVGLTGPFARA